MNQITSAVELDNAAPFSLSDLRAGALTPAGGALTQAGGFDLDRWHAMDERDNELIRDEILSGTLSRKFVYSFKAGGETAEGVSVIGARHLATFYGGLKHRILSSIEKRGSLFIFTSYPQEGQPMSMTCSSMPDIQEPDFYKVVIEMTDMKKGNTVQMEKTELRLEKRSENKGGGYYERKHFAQIAQSKCYRNAVLALLPQDVVQAFCQQAIQLGQAEIIRPGILDQKRDGVLAYAARVGIAVDRQALMYLTIPQIQGISGAARDQDRGAFIRALSAVGVLGEGVEVPPAPVVEAAAAPEQASHAKAAAPAEAAQEEAESGTKDSGEPQEAQQQTGEPPADDTPPWDEETEQGTPAENAPEKGEIGQQQSLFGDDPAPAPKTRTTKKVQDPKPQPAKTAEPAPKQDPTPQPAAFSFDGLE